MAHDFSCLATGIGSLPLTDPDVAVALTRRYLPEAPVWPQLPKRGFQEQMGAQYSEALPGIVRDEARQRFFFDTTRDLTAELERFYERYLEKDYEYFGLSEDFAAGFHAFLRALEKSPPAHARFLKGHVTGPLTAGISFKDEQGRDIIHHEQLFDAVVKNLAMKAAWQIVRLGRFGKPVIVFLDEPAMETLGSAFSPAAPELVAEKLDEIIDAIHERGGIAGRPVSPPCLDANGFELAAPVLAADVEADHVEDDVLKGGVAVMAVRAPAAGGKVNLHIPAPGRRVADLHDRAPEIGAALDAAETRMKDAHRLAV